MILGFAGEREHAAWCLDLLLEHAPPYGYLPEVDKSHYVCKAEDEEVTRGFFCHLRLDTKMSGGRDYIGVFIGSAAIKYEWFGEMFAILAQLVGTLS